MISTSRARITAATVLAASAALVVPAAAPAAAPLASGPATGSPSGPDTVDVTGIVRVLPGEGGEDDRLSLMLPSGATVLLPEGFRAEPLSRFAGTLLVPGDGTGARLSGSARAAALREATSSGEPLRVVSARVAPAAPAPSNPPHTTYVAKVNNWGPIAMTDQQILTETAAAQQWWVQQSAGVIPSWTTATGVVPVASSVGSAAAGCGLGSSGAEFDSITAHVGATAFPGVDFSGRSPNHLVVVVPASCGGDISGRAAMGVSLASGGPTIVDARAGYRGTLEHEYGHTLGLHHANNVHAEYGNLYEVMGSGPAAKDSPALGTVYRHEQGILAPGEAAEGTAGGAWTLAARSSATGLRGVHFINPDDGRRYFVDNRAGGGVDTNTCYATANYCNYASSTYKQDYRSGLVLSREDGTSGSFLLAVAGNDGALQAGESWTNAGGSMTVTAETASRVRITRAPRTPLAAGTASIGSPVAHREVRATASIAGATAYRYQWLLDGQPIPHAEEQTFRPTPAMAGRTLTVAVTGYAVGRDPSPPARSAPQAVQPAGWYAEGARRYPEITGTTRVGEVLTAHGLTWVDYFGQRPADLVPTYQWTRSGTAIPGATGPTYRLTAQDRGRSIQVTEVPRAAGFSSSNYARSAGTPPIALGRLVAARPKITGKARAGRTVKAATPGWTSGTRFTYQWFLGKKAVKGATKRKLGLTRSMRGKKVTVKVTGRRAGYSSASLKSKSARVR